ncbi:XAC0095 family protein [Pseudoxanthomonas sp. 22568]|uniref:XAC0095 family protein n=1 Tax=Pseudoxanthomonas sp. 22568 TaxID=3453945 RepID=UPI003F866AD9
MTNPRMVYLLEEETQLNMIQLRDHVKLLSTLSSPRFRKDEHHCLPVPLQALSDCFAYIAQDINDMLDALRYHYGEPEADEAAGNA